MKINHQGTKKLETKQCFLRPLNLEDTSDIHRYLSLDKPMHETFLFPDYEEEEETKQFIIHQMSHYDELNFYCWAMVHKITHETIGLILTLNPDDMNYATEIGYVVARNYWNQGICTEALEVVSEYLFEIGYHRLIASYIQGNLASGRVMEKCGFEFEGVLKDALYYHEQFHNLVQMSKIKE